MLHQSEQCNPRIKPPAIGCGANGNTVWRDTESVGIFGQIGGFDCHRKRAREPSNPAPRGKVRDRLKRLIIDREAVD